ncbi:MAG: hypothetical protein J6L64_01675 [Opitutales bacterium]|nr:hypothetical protein [Opitutales bacterium]
MKSLTLLSLIVAGSAYSGVFASGAASNAQISQFNLGNVMFVGDSITHGVNSASYRWEMHKILVDNGVLYNGVGYKSGHHSGGVSNGEIYGGVGFSNAHSSQASARAWEIAGVMRGTGGRFDFTNISNWLGLSQTDNKGGAYSGNVYSADTFFLLIGTNDLLSDNTAAGVTVEKVNNLLGENLSGGDMKTIVDAMYQSNANANVTVFSIPSWTTHLNSNDAKVHGDVAAYNVKLGTWVENYNKTNGKKITYVDVNEGIIDVASETPFFGCSSMFNKPGTDGLHPNAQGDLIIAGNAAKALGYAGRTAGQARKAESDFSKHFASFESVPVGVGISSSGVAVQNGALSFSEAGQSSLTVGWDSGAELKDGFTVDFGLQLGNGAIDGWDKTNYMSVTVGDSQRYGVLNINEAYIQWGDTVLYSKDMSKNKESLRVSYVVGNAAEGLASGFYVWLDDMLIGQGLGATTGTNKSGVTFSYSGTGTVLLENFSMDGTGSYAPDTTRYTNTANAYYASDPSFVPSATPQGLIGGPSGWIAIEKNGLVASGQYSVQDASGFAGAEWSTALLRVSGGSATHIYANDGRYTGSLFVEIQGGSASSWYGGHTGEYLNGNITMRLTGTNTGGSTVFGAVNSSGVVQGSVYLDFVAEESVFNSFTNTNSVSVAGGYNASITGTLHVQIGAGTFNYDVIGGLHTANNGQSIGQTKIFVNGGALKGDVYGGGFAGRVGAVSPQAGSPTGVASSVTVTGGTISGAIYGGGSGDTINGNASVSVTGGTILGGIYGGGSGGTINGNTSVTLDGNIAQLRASPAEQWCTISAGGTGGTITGNSTVTLKNLGAGNSMNGVDRYAGTISGGTNVKGTKTLVLENVTVKNFEATLSDFNTVSVTGNTSTKVTSLGGASTLDLATGTSLSIGSTADLTALKTVKLGAGANLSLDFTDLASAGELMLVVEEGDNTFSILAVNGSPDMDLSRVKFKVGDEIYDAETKIPDAQAGTVFVGYSIPEPSAFSLLAGVGAIALAVSRHRRSHR